MLGTVLVTLHTLFAFLNLNTILWVLVLPTAVLFKNKEIETQKG